MDRDKSFDELIRAFDEDLVGRFPADKRRWLPRYARLILLAAFAANIAIGLAELFWFHYYWIGLFNFVLGAGVPLAVILKTRSGEPGQLRKISLD